jgi:2-polyprenyl-6-methoxyphenol hydroxylase-like FAD-dependent oxidoreductase
MRKLIPARVQVLIVGGGPNGLSMALFLARLGVRSLLVERRATTSDLPRATQISRRTMELFREAGLEDEMRQAGLEVVSSSDPRATAEPTRFLPRDIVAVRSLADIGQAEILDDGAQELSLVSPCPPLWCGQDRFEPLLHDAARRHGADLRFGHELVEWEARDESVHARIRCLASGREHDVRSRFLVAADGARGTIAARLGIRRTGIGLVARRLTILFRADLSDVLRGRRFFISMIENGEFSGSVMPLNERDRWAAAVERSATGQHRGNTPTRRHLDLVRAAIGDARVPVALDAVFGWRAEHGVATEYRRGPVFLLGDAAHLHPPAGGYGFNVGFQDAHNLAWKMAASLAGWGSDRLLDTYQAERRPVAEGTAVQALLFDGVPAERLGGVQRCDARLVIGSYRYESAAVAAGQPGGPFSGGPFSGDTALSGEPGTRVPHAWLRRHDGRTVSTLDLCGNGFTLFCADPSWLAAAAEVGRAHTVPLTGYDLNGGRDRRLVASGTFAEACGLGRHGAMLVRPDGFVAWRTASREDTVSREETVSPEDTAASRRARLRAVLASVVGMDGS